MLNLGIAPGHLFHPLGQIIDRNLMIVAHIEDLPFCRGLGHEPCNSPYRIINMGKTPALGTASIYGYRFPK